MAETVDCAKHGSGLPCGFLCQHLVAGAGGWNDSGTEELCPDAWCDACETRRQVAGGWNDEAAAEAGIRVACAYCYHGRRGARLTLPGLDCTSAGSLAQGARVEMQRRNDAVRDTFSTRAWWFDLDEAELEFREGSVTRVRCRIAMVGSYSDGLGTWQSAWSNPSLPAMSAARSAAVLGFAETHRLPELAEPRETCTLTEAWGRAAVGAMLQSAVGLYRCPSDDLHVFLALLDVRPEALVH